MDRNYQGELLYMKEMNIKPNFSAMARRYGVSRHTLKRCYEAGKIPDRKKRSYDSGWDPYYDEIKHLFEQTGASKSAIYKYLENKYKDLPGTYNSLKSYTLRKGIKVVKAQKAHVLYETPPGELLQFDWKESLSIRLKDGSLIDFNVFSATLSYSRKHVFIYTKTKTKNDLIRCLIETFRKLGGTPQKAITDNMSAAVSINGKNRKIHAEISQLMKDLNIKFSLAKVRTPQTKGKVENSNKFLDWLKPYDGKLESEDDLIRTIETVITGQANNQVNTGINTAPNILFKKEKEYLAPLGNNILLENYLKDHKRAIVPSTLLVDWKGAKYSVSKKYIGRYVDLYQGDGSLYIYHDNTLIAIHTISQNKINYDKTHYIDALQGMITNSDIDIEEMAKNNLERLSKLGGN